MAANIEQQQFNHPQVQFDEEDDGDFDLNGTDNRSFADRTLSDRV